MSIEQRELIEIYRKLFPQATESDTKVTLTIKGVSITFDKPVNGAKSQNKRNISYG